MVELPHLHHRHVATPLRAARRTSGAVLVLLALLVLAAPARASEHPPRRPSVLADVPVTSINLQDERGQNSPTIAVDPRRPRFAALANRIDGRAFDCALQVSGDGGRSWLPVRPVPVLPKGAERCYAPEIAIDRKGTLYYLFLGLRGRANEPMGVFLTTSTDRGRTFSSPRQVLGSGRYMVRMALDASRGSRGRLHLVWLEVTAEPTIGGFPPVANPILSAHSDDGGRTFSDPVQVSDPQRDRVVAPAVAVGPKGAVHVAYYDLQDDAVDYRGLEGPTWDGTWSVVVSSSLDAGGAFTRHVAVDEQVRPPERVMLIFTMAPPAIVADPVLAVAWTDARHGDWDAMFARSTGNGRRWTKASRLNDDAIGNGRHQYLPRLSASPAGRLDAMFYDRRDDPENIYNHVSFTFSTDGGRRFAPNLTLTSEPSYTGTGARYPIVSAAGKVEFGSRLALVSGDERALAAWTDTRLPPLGVTQQDVFATEVRFAGNSGSASTAGVSSRSPVANMSSSIVSLMAVGIPAATATAVIAMGGANVVSRSSRRRRFGRPQGSHALLAALACLATLAGGCSSSTSGEVDALPPPAPVLRVSLDEYAFGHGSPPPAGRMVVEVVNDGELPHELVLVAVPADMATSIDAQLRSEQRRPLPTVVHLRERQPGQRGVFAVDLPVGRYALICFLMDADGQQHSLKGMSADLQIEAGPPA